MIARPSHSDHRVTISAQRFRRSASSSRARGLVRAPLCLVACLFAAAALPAFAQQAPGSSLVEGASLQSDLAEGAAPTRAGLMPEAMTLSDRALFLASDINRLLVSGKTAATSADYQPTDSRITIVLQRALALLGTPYRWGGTSPDKGFDCSGLVSYVFRHAMGLELPRVSRDMAKSGELISDRTKLAAGDLVFFGRRGRVDHVGIYVGEGRFVHAPRTGKDVMVSSLDSGYWSRKYLQARRVAGI
jgi:cell wall-associated NlpC family hydrolase